MALQRLAIRADAVAAEPLRALLLELVPSGLEELDAPRGEVELAVYVDDEQAAEVRSRFPDACVSAVDPGWRDAWRRFHRPTSAGGLWLGPPWERPPGGARTVVIDPGRAFGTGAHPTTRLSIELLADGPRGALLDIGCGSGVVAIAGVRLGFDPVVAVDVDPIAVEVTRANAAANGVLVEARVVDAEDAQLPAVDVAVANVLLRPVETILARVDADVAITSGYLDGELPAHPGWAHVCSATLDGWAADRFRRPR